MTKYHTCLFESRHSFGLGLINALQNRSFEIFRLFITKTFDHKLDSKKKVLMEIIIVDIG